ncbi:MAG: MBL fold metallo-hydrolase [Polyangiaceae bacterium]|nr:MBL fold metallo-hydrolase [Polyangiaceae bacterium]
MTKRTKLILVAVAAVVLVAGGLVGVGCRPTTHPVKPADLGTARSSKEMIALLDEPGPVTLETLASADWEVPLSGLLNLDHPKAKLAGLVDRPEPIEIYFHAIEHPTRGLFIVDTGVERAFSDDRENAILSGVVADVMNVEALVVRQHLGGWLGAQRQPLAGVLMTHLHADHVTGMRDVPRGTPIYAGPGETSDRHWQNLFVQPVLDRAFAGHEPISEWRFSPDPDGVFAGVLDVFGDGSVFALSTPGHTSGSTSYLVRTTTGPVLLVGDACHTAWGWENGVEPGSFSHDRPGSAQTLAALKQLVSDHPTIQVRLGHQAPQGAAEGERLSASAP